MTTDEREIWRKLNECKAVKKVKGWWEIGDHYYSHRDSCVLVLNDDDTDLGIEDLFVPPLFDPIRPERSLWGMSEKIREEWSVMQAGIFMHSDRPDLVLAEMIIEQEGR